MTDYSTYLHIIITQCVPLHLQINQTDFIEAQTEEKWTILIKTFKKIIVDKKLIILNEIGKRNLIKLCGGFTLSFDNGRLTLLNKECCCYDNISQVCSTICNPITVDDASHEHESQCDSVASISVKNADNSPALL